MKYPNDEYLTEIGRVCVAFSELESNYHILIELLTDVSSKSGLIVASQLSFQKLLDVAGALVLHHLPGSVHTKSLEGILKRSAVVEAKRNTVIHSHYFVDDASLATDTIRNKSTAKRFHGLKHQREIIKPVKMRTLSNEIESVAEEVEDFVVMLMGHELFRSKLRKK